MKIKKLILNLFATLGMILLILPLFLTMWTSTIKIGNNAADPTLYSMFADWSAFEDVYALADKTFGSVWALITEILMVAMLAFAVLYVILFILQLLKVGGKKAKYAGIMKVIACIILALAIIALFTAIIFVASNSWQKGTVLVTTYTFGLGIGAYLAFIGAVITGLTGIIANLKK